MEISKKITELRTNKGLSMHELARDLGVSCACISYWKNDKRYPNSKQITILCNYFEVTPNELFECSYQQVEKLRLKNKELKGKLLRAWLNPPLYIKNKIEKCKRGNMQK